ncbi:hypothetical protein ACFQY5_40145 [Paeniroseomonas aquatica]|uniref:hypothetical protein n=1 Tax=Paeniroseomonas aquatica TaxID=373043 RepID=UPI00361CE199
MTFEKLREELAFLLAPGRIGAFDHIELIEVIGTPRGGVTINVLSVAVLAEGHPNIGDTERTERLTERIGRIDGFRDWSFGVMRTLRPVAALDQALSTLAASGEWTLSGHTLGTGTLRPDPAMFVPPDGTVRVPINNVLKNNFGRDRTCSGSRTRTRRLSRPSSLTGDGCRYFPMPFQPACRSRLPASRIFSAMF